MREEKPLEIYHGETRDLARGRPSGSRDE